MADRLYRKLMEYDKKNIYPFHMPGHKRNPSLLPSCFPVSMDITEITGFDDLHHPEDLILEAQTEAAELFGSLETHFVINGSTAAILSAVSACVRRGGKILVARNCHKSVYHAVYLRGLVPEYVYPSCFTEVSGLSGGISPEDVEKAFLKNRDIEALVITSPTYDGVVSDVKAIADIAHRYGAVLIVDEAHGAHFSFSDYFPESAVVRGADLVIQSIHKTLPSLTQTALLHRCSDRVDPGKVRRFLSIYQSSSPSHILMAAMDACMELLRERSRDLFADYTERLEACRERLAGFQNIRLITPEKRGAVYDFDRSRLILSPVRNSMSGTELFRRLRRDHGIELEMSGMQYVLALSSVGDTEEGFDRLVKAVSEIDAGILGCREGERAENLKDRLGKVSEEAAEEVPEKAPEEIPEEIPKKIPEDIPEEIPEEIPEDIQKKIPEDIPEEIQNLVQERILLPSEAMEKESIPCLLERSAGKISAEFVYVYPPGAPVLVPGEEISEEVIKYVRICQSLGMNLQGMQDREHRSIQVVEREKSNIPQ